MEQQANLNQVDWSQYASWPSVTMPSGAVYYKVPGTGYVYDPFLSQQKGKPVIWTNPQARLDEKARIEKLQKQAASPMGQIAPVLGGTAGIIGANYAIKALGPKTAETALQTGAQAGTAAAAPVASTTAQAFQAGASGALPNGIASMPGNMVQMADGTLQAGAPIIDGVDNAATAAHPGFFAQGTTAGNLLGGAGVALGAYGAYQGIKDQNPMTSGMGGLGIGLGLNQLGYALGPYGWAAAVGIPVIASLAGKFGDKDMWKTESNRLNSLKEKGVFVPPGLIESMPQGAGRSKEELVKIAQETGGNVKFASSRDEKDLTGADLIGFSTFAERDPEWFKRSRDQQVAYAQQLLDKGLVREHHGTIDVNWAKADPAPWEAKQEPAKPTPEVQTGPKVLGKKLAERQNSRNKK